MLWLVLLAPLAALALVVGMPRLQRWAEPARQTDREGSAAP